MAQTGTEKKKKQENIFNLETIKASLCYASSAREQRIVLYWP
jgi:hypothetical protein